MGVKKSAVCKSRPSPNGMNPASSRVSIPLTKPSVDPGASPLSACSRSPGANLEAQPALVEYFVSLMRVRSSIGQSIPRTARGQRLVIRAKAGIHLFASPSLAATIARRAPAASSPSPRSLEDEESALSRAVRGPLRLRRAPVLLPDVRAISRPAYTICLPLVSRHYSTGLPSSGRYDSHDGHG